MGPAHVVFVVGRVHDVVFVVGKAHVVFVVGIVVEEQHMMSSFGLQ